MEDGVIETEKSTAFYRQNETSGGEKDHETEQGERDDDYEEAAAAARARGGGGERGGGERPGGLISNFITNLVSPLSPKQTNEKKVQDFEGKADDERTQSGEGGGVGGGEGRGDSKVENEVKTEEEGGGGGGGGIIIDNLVSHLPASLADVVAPTTDEASILIHIIHD